MKKLFAFWKRIPRPTRTIIYFACILLCMAIIIVLSKIPSYTAEMQYRRLEKQHMIGPAKILGTETLSGGSAKLLVAKSDTELMLYRYWIGDYVDYNSTDLVCRKKHGDLTILAAGGNHPSLAAGGGRRGGCGYGPNPEILCGGCGGQSGICPQHGGHP